MSNINLISIERIEKTIYLIRGEKVMLDRDLGTSLRRNDWRAQSGSKA